MGTQSVLTHKDKTMGLKITTIDSDHVHGTLDGVLNFEIASKGGRIFARIHNWTREISDRSTTSVGCMRSLAYEVLARYREDRSPA